ncbi:hypothetical protein KSB_92140 [Ktedonobacter robiniae]|uniref:Uncharacterized protein n=2 Tax=Ktedonobacter robiniae TaxID=2778365 RepID=A0ABQ3V6X3_9CHLR|nr:hypothetical protein KSB_92140 [Ktedonobacter robiniae]
MGQIEENASQHGRTIPVERVQIGARMEKNLVKVLKILLKRSMIMPSCLEKKIAVLKRTVASYAFNEGVETFAGILKNERGTCLKTLVAFKECSGEKACNVPKLADINTNINGFLSQERNGSQIRP